MTILVGDVSIQTNKMADVEIMAAGRHDFHRVRLHFFFSQRPWLPSGLIEHPLFDRIHFFFSCWLLSYWLNRRRPSIPRVRSILYSLLRRLSGIKVGAFSWVQLIEISAIRSNDSGHLEDVCRNSLKINITLQTTTKKSQFTQKMADIFSFFLWPNVKRKRKLV